MEVGHKAEYLPYGTTLHYPGCGCPQHMGRRNADLVDQVVSTGMKLYQKSFFLPARPLKVAYMLPHHNLTGGMKCLVE